MNTAKTATANPKTPCYLIEDSPAEIAALDQAFWVKIAHQQADADKAREVGIPALKRLFELAETRDSGQIKTVATVLAACYNGRRFRIDLNDFRMLDVSIFGDVMSVIKLNTLPGPEVHEYFDRGGERFEKMFKKFGLKNSKDE